MGDHAFKQLPKSKGKGGKSTNEWTDNDQATTPLHPMSSGIQFNAAFGSSLLSIRIRCTYVIISISSQSFYAMVRPRPRRRQSIVWTPFAGGYVSPFYESKNFFRMIMLALLLAAYFGLRSWWTYMPVKVIQTWFSDECMMIIYLYIFPC